MTKTSEVSIEQVAQMAGLQYGNARRLLAALSMKGQAQRRASLAGFAAALGLTQEQYDAGVAALERVSSEAAAAYVPPAPRVHGKVRTYQRGCRCAACRSATTIYARGRREKKRKPLDAGAATH